MSTLTFDSLAYAKKLENAGFTREQADAQAETLSAAFSSWETARMKELATKADLQLETEKLRTEMKAMEIRLLKWQWGIAFALAVIMAKGFGWLGF